jgi:hypothetical protein
MNKTGLRVVWWGFGGVGGSPGVVSWDGGKRGMGRDPP